MLTDNEKKQSYFNQYCQTRDLPGAYARSMQRARWARGAFAAAGFQPDGVRTVSTIPPKYAAPVPVGHVMANLSSGLFSLSQMSRIRKL